MQRTICAVGLGLALAACSSSGGVMDKDAGGNVPPVCKSTTMPTVLVDDFKSGTRNEATYVTEEIVPPSLVGDDLYWIDTSQGPLAENGNFNNGVVKHLSLDGGAPSTVVTPTGYLFQAIALGQDIFYLQEDKTGSNPNTFEAHLYRAPRAGGAGTQVGTAAIAIGHEGLFLPNCGWPCGVFAQKGDDVFINAVGEIDRVNLTTGTVTAIARASGPSPHSLWGALLDADTIYYQEGDGAAYSVAASATTPSGQKVGTVTCGNDTLNLASMRRYSGGFICSDRDAIFSADTGFTSKKVWFESQKADPKISTFTATPLSGTTLFAMPEYVVQDWDKTSSVFQVDTATGKATPVVCNVHSVVWSALGSSQVVYVEGRTDASHNKFFSLRAVPR